MSDLKQDTINYTVRLGDDALILGHRISEWVSNGPFLEEDIALGNVSLDFIGRARMFYTYAADLSGEGKTEDHFAYMRNEREFQNYLINELPRGDFAYTIARQLFVDTYNHYFLTALTKSSDENLAAIAAKAVKETKYHLRRSTDWTLRLGDGTEESHKRMQAGIDDVWGYTKELFEHDELEQRLIDAGIAVDATRFKDQWLADIAAVIKEATLEMPDGEWAVRGGREGYHTENLGHILTELQYLHRCYPNSEW
ncbi:phenylacetate-CoA oxygenase subunit PaaC [Pseudomaricurvus alkylphenolicus]|jgi:ring-1,2-phenylacetyl-CoA epoxidase subunit PaaC|uniref:1,2-phenylacetyl-CoA epoxidase subunit PaaC n=1 Tax=Pseudomaricurvus alkylphenolicus TaxID=1306991 RepID=UPI001421372E|nr:1,2-phenylacetyl-CoA epoxidase subunit PaaC [Pseudomaricurvus alkylphenolicus]NIB40905.1 phenylacetate-CoA oxygenase subunit PaaC [Pseudomaricurvus alkylphenolicus]